MPTMTPRLFPALLALCLAVTAASAEDKPGAGTMTRTPAPPAPPSDTDLTTYYVGLITKGSHFDAYNREDREKIQKAHLANLDRLAQLGKILVAGPCPDNGEWRGIYIFKCASIEEAKQFAASDPEVQTGRLKIEIHPWMTEKGSIRDPEFPPSK
jgi:uncharacterized protein YciI